MVNLSAERFSPKRLSPSNIKAKVEPHLHWKVPMEEGVYKDPRWSNPDLDPVKPEDRTWGALVGSLPTCFLLLLTQYFAGLLGMT